MSVKEQVWVMCCKKYKTILVNQKNPCTSNCRDIFNGNYHISIRVGPHFFYHTLLRNNCLTHTAEHNQIPSLETTDVSIFLFF